jgi:hypothetical protein
MSLSYPAPPSYKPNKPDPTLHMNPTMPIPDENWNSKIKTYDDRLVLPNGVTIMKTGKVIMPEDYQSDDEDFDTIYQNARIKLIK